MVRYRGSIGFTLILVLSLVLAACGGGGGSDEQANSGGNQEPAAPTNALVLRMLYGSEKQSWIEDVTKTFNDQQNQSTAGRSIFIEAVPIGSLESMYHIIDGTEKPAIWSPASSLVFPLANEKWANSHGGEELVGDDAAQLVLSPVVIAMWRPMAEVLGWPDTPIGWEEIESFAREDKTWADYNYPEWGAFKFGHTHPDHSNSGFTTILTFAYAGSGKTRDLTVDDVQKDNVSTFIENLESTVIHYGKSTGFFAEKMINGGPGYLSAAVLYENLVMESYNQELYPNRSAPIVAIYPKEGTFWSDHPFAIMPWVMEDEEMLNAAETYRDYLLAEPQQQRALHYGFRPSDTSIPIVDTFTEAKGVDATQPTALLEIPDSEVIHVARGAWGEKKKRVEVMVLLDVSGSMNDKDPPDNTPRLVAAKNGLQVFIEQLADADHVGLTTFSGNAQQVTPLDAVGPKREDLLKRIQGLFAEGGTRLIDTTMESYEELKNRPRGERIHAIVVLSDGDDTVSSNGQDELINLVSADREGYSIKVFTIAYGSGSGTNLPLLESIANASGGKFYLSTTSNIKDVFMDIGRFF